MGRPIGRKTSKPNYRVKYLDTTDNNPEWYIYECATYRDITKIIKEKHSQTFSRDVLQNIMLQRYIKTGKYNYIQVEQIEDVEDEK